ncbi:MAG: 5-formyltetrahydrofolate cyclo-ligase [Oscillospiraceae bacterium]
MDKRQLRAYFLRQTAALEQEYTQRADEAIARRLYALPEFAAAGVVFCYVGVKREVATRAILVAALAAGKTVCVPKCFANGVMQARRITGLAQLRPAAFGLLEPGETAPLVQPGAIHFCVVPCVAADRQGNRLGYGGGYYDRYLPQMQGHTACLCRHRLLQASLPQEPHDLPVQLVLTEEECIRPAGAKP